MDRGVLPVCRFATVGEGGGGSGAGWLGLGQGGSGGVGADGVGGSVTGEPVVFGRVRFLPAGVSACGSRARRGFTLIELLVGLLLPALAKAREQTRRAVCASNVRQSGLSLTLYSNDWRDWFPVFARPNPETNFLDRQFIYGGVAGLFSLWQDPTVAGGVGPVGWRSPLGGIEAPRYSDGNLQPLLGAYVEGYEHLTCPSDQINYYFGPSRGLIGGANPAGGPIQPKAPSNINEVVHYNLSYLYIAGFKNNEAQILTPAPLWGEKTNGNDISTEAWYGGGSGSVPAFFATADPSIRSGFFGKLDNHGTDGGNYVYTDGHVEFTQGDIQKTFFERRTNPNAPPVNPKSINVVNPNRSNFVQTID